MPSLVRDNLRLEVPDAPPSNVDLKTIRIKGKLSLDNGPGEENTVLVDFDGPNGEGTNIWSLFAGLTTQEILNAIGAGAFNADQLATTFAGDTIAGY